MLMVDWNISRYDPKNQLTEIHFFLLIFLFFVDKTAIEGSFTFCFDRMFYGDLINHFFEDQTL